MYYNDPEVNKFLLLRIVFNTGCNYTYFLGVRWITMGDATTLFMIAPIGTVIAAGLLLGEKITYKDILASILCLAGIIFIVKPHFITHYFIYEAHHMDIEGRMMGITVCLISGFLLIGDSIVIKMAGDDIPAITFSLYACVGEGVL